ncbi:MAG: hypothetical protein ACOCV8_06010 [Spirochaetota bacterium]
MKSFSNESVRITAVRNQEEKSVEITFTGELFIKNEKTEEQLSNYFKYLYNEIYDKIKNITMDFSELNTISSYGIRILINWLKKFDNYNNNASIEDKYKINIVYDEQIEWQETTFLSLKEIFRNLAEFKKI